MTMPQLRAGEGRMIARFIAVGLGATLGYLGASLLLLRWGVQPQLANVLAFALGISASYAGQYYFTYRASDAHARLSARFLAVTLGLLGLSALAHQLLLWAGLSPQTAALGIALGYPPASFLLNHFWAFSRGAGGSA